jgi:hypothetical protein
MPATHTATQCDRAGLVGCWGQRVPNRRAEDAEAEKLRTFYLVVCQVQPTRGMAVVLGKAQSLSGDFMRRVCTCAGASGAV